MINREELRQHIAAAWQQRNLRPEDLLAPSKQMLARAEALGDPGLVADCLRNLAWAEAMLSQCDAALDHVLRAQALYDQTGDVPGQAAALNILATAHLNMDSYGDSLKAALQSLAMYEQSLPGQSRVEIYGNIGIAYAYLEDWEKATEYMQHGLKEARAHKDAIGELDHLNSLGYTCFLQGDYARALAYCEQALALARRHGARHQLAYILHSLGETLGVSGDLDRALACFEEGLATSRAIDHNSYAAANLRGIAGVLRQQGHLDAALASLQQALAVAGQQSSPRELALIHQQLAAFYEQQGDLSQALAHHRQFYALQKDLLSIRADQRVKGLQTLHDLELARVEADSEREKNRILHQQLALHEQHISDLDFYAHTVAHDLRNPISIVIGFSTMLLEELESKLDPDQLQGLNLIFETGRKMEQIVEELLMLATHQEQGVLHQPVAMEHVFKEALHRLEIMTAKHEASIRLVTPLPPVRGHPAWLEEVWVNYLSNAIKYGGCPPRVEVAAQRTRDGCVRFWVHDNGDGILPAQQSRLFQEGVRLSGLNRDGYGLGLSIVRRIIERLGGQVGVESSGEPGAGAAFFFTLPLADIPPNGNEAESSQPRLL